MPEVLAIENQSFQFPWSEEDFIRVLRQLNCIGMVAEYDDHVVGFMIYELHQKQLHVLNVAVRSDVRRQTIGAQLIEKLKTKISPMRRNRICLEVWESNLSALLFFKDMGFRAVSVLKGSYEDDETTEDAYLMQFACKSLARKAVT